MVPMLSSEEKIIRKLRKLPEDRKLQVLDFVEFLSKKGRPVTKEGDAYGTNLETLRLKIRERGGLFAGQSSSQIIERLRATREEVWKEDYADHFGQ